ncbi:MAG: OmpH family outer membrane protein [Elusimicrobiota bacterium]
MKYAEQTQNNTRNRHGNWRWIFFSTFLPFYLSTFLYSATISIQRIGCVDMNRIMDEYPDAKKIKYELSANLNTRKENIKNFESQIIATELEIKQMEEQLQTYNEEQKKVKEIAAVAALADGANISSSTETVVVVDTRTVTQISSPTFTTADIEIKKVTLEKQKSDLEKYIAATKQEEKDINNKAKKNIMGKIYDAIKEVSNEEGLTVLVDSCNLIYGEDAQDITEKVLKKMK